MDQELAFPIKIILNHAIELNERQEEFFGNRNLLATFYSEWIDILSRITEVWIIASLEQKELIRTEYEKVKPLAQKLKLPWPEELIK